MSSFRHELHLHSCYSFLDGASEPEELAARARDLGYEALALTDHDGLYGAMAFAVACNAVGVQPITGAEVTLRHGLLDADTFGARNGLSGARNGLSEARNGPGLVHLTLLVEDERGYGNLCRIITEAHRKSHKAVEREPGEPVALDPSFLQGCADGLIALSGCREGELARLVDAGRRDDALEAARRLVGLFGQKNTFVELQQNLVYGDTRRVAELAELAARLGLPVVATGDVHYHDRSRHRLQDAMVAIRNRATLESSHALRRPNSEFYLRPPAQAGALFADLPEAIASAAEISARCAGFNLARRDVGYVFPDFARLAHEGNASDDQVLAAYCLTKFEERYPPGHDLREQARRQLAEELAAIGRHRLSGFFLIYRDLQELATEVAREVRGAGTVRGGAGLPPGRGRGSSVSSIVCYLIGLSHVDPVRHRLFFRRFLNEDLQSVPDIDLDFARDIREELILRTYTRYGPDHAALVCSFATYHLRSAVRDLGKVLGLPPAAIDKLAKLSEGGGADTVREELERLPELRGQRSGSGWGPLWSHLIELAEQIDGLPRHIGQHVGGMIISSKPVVELVPVQPAAMAGRFICQWDKDSCDDARFVKIDFLALGMLSLVEECLELTWRSRGEKVDLAGLAYDDPAVYQDICRGDTVGMFQIESRAQIQMLTRTLPRDLDDLAVQVAIVRPGPIVGGAVNPYVRRRELRRHNPHAVIAADHPLLNDVLSDTLGVVLYQDQVLEVAIRMGRFTAGQADQFRRAMSRRRSAEAMERFRTQFVAGATSQGVAEGEAQAIFDKLAAFSGFGFPKSHAYAFAILAYQSAYLRHYYPPEYYAALLNNQPMGFYAPHVLVGDARRHGVTILRVSINRSEARATPSKEHVRLGLGLVSGIGEETARALVAERERNGPYRSLRDLLVRTGLPRAAAENLIAVGALAELGLSRRELLWHLGLVGGWGSGRPRTGGPAPSTRQLPLALPTEQDMVELEDMTEWERMVADYGLLGLSPSYHPLGLLRRRLPRRLLTAAQVRRKADGERIRTVGLVVCRQRPGTAKGFVFLLLEDETGLTNVVVRPDLYELKRSVIRGDPYLVVEGTLQWSSGSLNLLAERVAPMSRIPGALMPKPAPQHRHAGNPHDPREQAGAVQARLETALPSPASHNFH
ncbi:MAG TPA: error-prone DNA polymerase [Chloroflexota bacterium]